MNWEKLKTFYKVAKAGSFMSASKIENKSQSTFSRAVIDLEYDIKTKVLARNNKGVDLTEDGKNLLAIVEDFSKKLDHFSKNSKK